MRILMLTGEFPPQQGGVGDYTQELARALARRGAQVTILTGEYGSVPAAVTQDAPRDPTPYTVQASVPRWDFGSWKRVAGAVRTQAPDVILIQYQTAAYRLHPAVNLLPAFLRLRLGAACPFIATTFHDLKFPYVFPKAGSLRPALVRALAWGSHLAIATNAEDLHHLLAWGLQPAADRAGQRPRRARVDLIPIGSNIACEPPPGYRRAAQRATWGVGPDAWLLCYFGFLNASKGGETLVAALGELVGQGHPAHLLMIGGHVGSSDPTNEAYLARVRQQILVAGLESRVHWTGFVTPPEVSANLLAADVCVLPYQDGAGRSRGSLMAALAHGLPIVTTQPQVPGPGFIHGETMWFVPPADAAAVAAALVHIQTDPALRARLARGAATLAQSFTWDAIAARHLARFEVL